MNNNKDAMNTPNKIKKIYQAILISLILHIMVLGLFLALPYYTQHTAPQQELPPLQKQADHSIVFSEPEPLPTSLPETPSLDQQPAEQTAHFIDQQHTEQPTEQTAQQTTEETHEIIASHQTPNTLSAPLEKTPVTIDSLIKEIETTSAQEDQKTEALRQAAQTFEDLAMDPEPYQPPTIAPIATCENKNNIPQEIQSPDVPPITEFTNPTSQALDPAAHAGIIKKGITRKQKCTKQSQASNILALSKSFLKTKQSATTSSTPDKEPAPCLTIFEEMKNSSYIQAISSHLQKAWRQNFASNPTLRYLRGTTLIDMTIDKYGKLANYNLVESSGNSSVDALVIKNITLAAPFPPLPARISTQDFTIRLTFNLRS